MSDLLDRLREREVPEWLRALYSVIYLATFFHAITTRGAWTCCPPAYGDDLATFAHAAQVAFAWTGVGVATIEVLITMVLLVPKVYYGIKEKGVREGELKGRAEGREEGKVEGKAEGKVEGRAEGRVEGKIEGRAEGRVEGRAEGAYTERERIAADLDAAGITDPEIRRIVMNGHGDDNPRANRNGQ